MKKLYTLSLIALLTACGGGSSSADFTPEEQTRLEEIKTNWEGLPNTPEESHPDYHTVKGVDDNSNNIRDDWELANALASYPNKDEFTLLNQAALNNNLMIDAYENMNESEMVRIFYKHSLLGYCYKAYFNYKNKLLLLGPSKDTAVRKRDFDKSGIYLNQLLPNDIEFPTYDVLEQKCPELIK